MGYELHVYNQCKHTDQAAVAEQEGLHPETVKGIFFYAGRNELKNNDNTRWYSYPEKFFPKSRKIL
jgi:hypothetical protein